MKIWKRGPVRGEEEAKAFPRVEQLLPPGQVLPKLLVEPDGVIASTKGTKKINHSAKESPPLRGNLAGMV